MTLKSVADSMRGHNAEAENNAENNLAKEKLATRKRSSVSSKKSLTSIRGSQSSQSSQIEDENTSISSQGNFNVRVRVLHWILCISLILRIL